MADKGLEVFDRTLQVTHAWLDDVAAHLGADPAAGRQDAWNALGAVLRVLRDRVPVGLAAHLGEQLPLLVRGLYYEGWRPTEPPDRFRTLDGFHEAVGAMLEGTRPLDPREAADAVFRVLAHRLDPGQVTKLVDVLPEPVRDRWMEVAAVRSHVAEQREAGREGAAKSAG